MTEGEGGCFDAVMHGQLLQNMAHMKLNRRQADVKLIRNLLIIQAPRHQVENLVFSLGEIREIGSRRLF